MSQRSSATDPSPAPGRCAWCRADLDASRRRDARFCSKRCRQTCNRLKKRAKLEEADGKPKRLAYADPPYPGLARKYYQHEASFAGEVDHSDLILSRLAPYDGWALSTSARALRDILPLCPPEARVCCWVKPIGASPLTFGIHNTWEPLIILPARSRRPGKRDWLKAQPARGGGSMPGRKPLAFVVWLFELLGAAPGDSLDDLFPGSGVVGRAWRELSNGSAGDVSPRAAGDGSSPGGGDASPAPRGDPSEEYSGDTSQGAQNTPS